MGKQKLLIILLLGGCFIKAAAQPCNKTYLGTKTLYTAPEKQPAAPPAGYKPVFINHVGRHGARHLTKEVSASLAWQFLNKADSLQMLTADGEKLRQMVLRLHKIEHGVVKSISAEGYFELKGLGNRMYAYNIPVFKKPIRLNVAITKEVRTKQSADAFLDGLRSFDSDSLLIKERNDDTNLRFYDLSPTYTNFEEKGAWLAQMDSLKKEQHLETLEQHIVARWFKPAFLQQLKYEETDKLVADVFGFLTISYSLDSESLKAGLKANELNFTTLFTCDELSALGKLDAAEGYYQKGPGLDNNGIQVRIAIPLLADFISTTDLFIKSHPVDAELRFAHAETISPFATLLDMEPASKHAASVKDIDKQWKAGEIIPLSSNIRWIIYKNTKRGDYLVKFLLNEKAVKIKGLTPVHKYYYHWKDARKYYFNKLIKAGVNLNSDMNHYLSNLK